MSPTGNYNPAGNTVYSPAALPTLSYQPKTIYITTDENSDYQLINGKHYFMDFDISGLSDEYKQAVPLDSMKYKFIAYMRDMGHDIKSVSVMVPEKDVIRIYFTANPLPLILLVAAAIAIIAVGVGIGSGLGSGAYILFKGLGEGGPLAPLIRAAVENPLAVIAIIIAVGLFILGIGFK